MIIANICIKGELIKMIIIMDILFHCHFFFLGYPSCHVEIDLHKQKINVDIVAKFGYILQTITIVQFLFL